MHFADPHFLWLLALPPLAALWRGRQGATAAIVYSTAERVRRVARARRARAGAWLTSLRLAVLALLIVALARPQQVLGTGDVETSGIDIVLAVDVSGSMEAMDFTLDGKPADRLAVVRSVVDRFIAARPNDRIGLVAFAGRPYLVSPLTLDHDWLRQNLDRLQVGVVEDGTAIGSGIAMSVNRLREQAAKSRIVILLTDGVNNAGKVSPDTAAEAARALGVKVYTIAAGTEGEAPIPVKDRFGRRQMVMAKVDVDEAALQQVAQATGAKSYRATDTDSLRRIYQEIDTLEKSTITAKKFEQYRELYPWALIAGLVLLLLERTLAQTRLRRLP
jgi:Ca-activated chloride channel family protein